MLVFIRQGRAALQKTHHIAHHTKLSDKVVYFYLSFSHENTPLFFYQKLSVGVYSTSEADTIVLPIWLSVLLPWKYQLLWNWISYFVYVLVTAPLLFAIRCKLTCPYINIMLYIFSFALNMHREFLQFMVSKERILRIE